MSLALQGEGRAVLLKENSHKAREIVEEEGEEQQNKKKTRDSKENLASGETRMAWLQKGGEQDGKARTKGSPKEQKRKQDNEDRVRKKSEGGKGRVSQKRLKGVKLREGDGVSASQLQNRAIRLWHDPYHPKS